ncbi:hypothetical protein EPN81_02880 [Patescibacteria group bacterium]|nr:MAG: hypothetical protein EPN81_02880 [Patescibacteria group bacterium]
MLKAQVERLADRVGVSLEIPDRPGVEVTPEIRAYILASRARYPEQEWLFPKGPRDQVCVRFGLSPAQVAGVLSGEARRNGNGFNHREQTDPEPVPAVVAQSITDQPETWPTRNGCPASAPERRIHALDQTDWEIAKAVLRAGTWNQRRGAIQQYRSLTGQQVAGMKAVLSRGHSPQV